MAWHDGIKFLFIRFYGAGSVNVETWLRELGLEQYAKAFADNGVDLALLPELTNDDLKDLGVDRLADRKAILKAIAAISECDSAPTLEPLSATAMAGERRQVSVLFADIAGYTKLSRQLGAEATHALLNRYFEVVDGIIESYGGSVDKHIGDNVMAVFGAPIAHDDDPLRAVRAALDIHERMSALADEVSHPLRAHIGIASGQVVASGTGSQAHLEYTVTGDSVNLASRLQDKAQPGETLISDALYRVVAERLIASRSPRSTLGVSRHRFRFGGSTAFEAPRRAGLMSPLSVGALNSRSSWVPPMIVARITLARPSWCVARRA